ncbi:MAG: hypothetical protein H2040_14050 [Euryhalocaulis sp.]|uniref:hypothetical protein n=1 Tax=Euryhalocaulis sp. TaxID=2744307 RepID=UPI0017C1BCC9|nr:hypothetical protein [Euryhalocaulis sp.]MBA4802972.1 hypothetical protein [Euryhalocaulis sp.]
MFGGEDPIREDPIPEWKFRPIVALTLWLAVFPGILYLSQTVDFFGVLLLPFIYVAWLAYGVRIAFACDTLQKSENAGRRLRPKIVGNIAGIFMIVVVLPFSWMFLARGGIWLKFSVERHWYQALMADDGARCLEQTSCEQISKDEQYWFRWGAIDIFDKVGICHDPLGELDYLLEYRTTNEPLPDRFLSYSDLQIKWGAVAPMRTRQLDGPWYFCHSDD